MTTLSIQDALAELVRLRGSAEAQRWLAAQPDVATAWAQCERPDWMLWFAARRGVEHQTFVRIACAFARLALDGADLPALARRLYAAGQYASPQSALQSLQQLRAAARFAAAFDALFDDPRAYEIRALPGEAMFAVVNADGIVISAGHPTILAAEQAAPQALREYQILLAELGYEPAALVGASLFETTEEVAA